MRRQPVVTRAGRAGILSGVILFAALLLIFTGTAGAADYYVDIQNGNDTTGNGFAGNPWQTLHHAATELTASVGHTIHIAAGVYSPTNGENDTSNLVFDMSDSVIQGDPAGGTIIDPEGTTTGWTYGVNLETCSNVTFRDIEVRGAEYYGIYVNDGSNNTITGCDITNNGTSGVYLAWGTGNTVSGCDIHENLGAGFSLWECDSSNTISGNKIYDTPYGLYINSPTLTCSPSIINNLIYNGESLITDLEQGIYLEVGESDPVTAVIHHNTIDGASLYGINMANNFLATVSPDIQYNNITNCGAGIADTGTEASTPTIDYNNLFNNGAAYDGISPGPNDISGDPLYNDSGLADYHLQAGSACVDAAVTSTISVDLDGNTRPLGAAADIGCYEFLPLGANSPPDPPEYVSPAPFQIFAPGSDVTLQGSAFSDPDGDSHVSSHWRVTRADIDYFSPMAGPFNYETTMDLTSYTISGTEFTQAGLAYRWQVGYLDSGSGQYAWTEEPSHMDRPPDVFVIGVQETDNAPPVAPGETAAAYQMVSAHHIPADPRAAAVIGDDLAGGYDASMYRLGVYDCEQGDYREYPDFMIYPGGAMWILAREGVSIDITGVPVATGVDMETSLRYNGATDNGWNMIGPPNDRNYLWSDIEVVEYDPNTGQVLFSEPIGFLAADNPYIDTRLWEWSGGQYSSAASIMESGQGYWVRARRPHLNLRFTVSAQVAWNNPGVLLAAAGQQAKHLADAVMGGSEAVAAGADETPPAPMAALHTSDRDDSSVDVTCFVSAIEE